MKAQLLNPTLSAPIGLLFTLPTAYFILISILKYAFGFPALFDSAAPALEALGIKESLGWNINLLIVFGPLIALLWNLSSVTAIDFHSDEQHIICDLEVEKRGFNWLVIVLSSFCLLILLMYLLGENCNC